MSPGLATRRLIVNADDFGLTAGVSRGILRAHREGLVTSATVLANLPPQPELDAAAAGAGLGLGLHFNLTWGRPVSPAGTVPSLVDVEGRFGRDLAALQERARPDDVRRECETQIEVFSRRFGRPPTHLDSHHHVHRRVPRVGDAVLDVALDARLPLRSQDAGFREGVRRRGVRTPDQFLGEDSVEPYWTAARLLDALAALPVGVTELMCHPGRYDEALAYSRYGRQRETELQALCEPEVRATVERLGIALRHFGTLPAS